MLMKMIFDAYLLQPLAKRVQKWIIDRSKAGIFMVNYLVCILRPLFLLVKLISPLIWMDVFKWYMILQFINISKVKGIVVTAVTCQIMKLWCNFLSRKWDLLRWSIWNSLGKLFVTENMSNLQLFNKVFMVIFSW